MSSANAIGGGLWLEPRIDWSWPGQSATASVADLAPPSWVRVRPLEGALGQAGAPAVPALRRHIERAAVLAGIFIVLCAIFTVLGSISSGHAGAMTRARAAVPHVTAARLAPPAPPATIAAGPPLPAAPPLELVSRDAAGSSISSASYASLALPGHGSFLVYLPAHFSASATRYPVLYLLHGNGEQGSAFLTLGIQGVLDNLIAAHKMPPLIAVMINGGPGANNWRNLPGVKYANYVVEVQRLVDEMLPTVALRTGRGIAGFSMGGFGAMNVALANPTRFSVVESWLGFFNGLGPALRADAATFAAAPLKAFIWGASGDQIADAAENAPFAARLRSVGVSARSAVYSGGHNFATIESHLSQMLLFAGDALKG